MKEIVPIGYAKTHMGLIVAVMFGGWGGFLCFMALRWGAELSVVLPFAILLFLLVAGIILSDVTTNIKAGKRMAHRAEMRKYTHAKGEIIEKKLYFSVGGRELPNAPAEELYLRKKNKSYRFRVAFEDPRTGQRRETVSEPYHFFSLYTYQRVGDRMELVAKYREGEAYVYVDLEGNPWVELIPVS